MGEIGGMDGAQFIVIVIGAIAGLIVIRFAAGYFVKLLTERPSLETAAMLLVGWVGVKLLMHTLAHPALHIIPHDFVEGPIWNTIFWSVMLLNCIRWLVLIRKETIYLSQSTRAENNHTPVNIQGCMVVLICRIDEKDNDTLI